MQYNTRQMLVDYIDYIQNSIMNQL